jgi:cytochrome c-type biogenesis protein CcmH
MSEFIFVALVLVIIALGFFLKPLMMNRSAVKFSRSEINVELYKDRLAELQADLDNGLINDVEFAELNTELQRRLLDEASTNNVREANDNGLSSKLTLFVCLFIPLFTWFVYHHTGAKPDWDIAQTMQQTRHKSAAGENTEAEVEQLVAQLEQRLSQKPEDPHYLMLMANTQMDLRNYPAATDAYQRLSVLFPDDASVLGRYAQALYLSSDRTLTSQVKSIADRALLINPQQSTTLGLLGIGSFEQGEYQQAISYWQRLLPMLGPVSPNRKMITAGIEQAKMKLSEAGIVIDEPKGTEPSASPVSINVAVSIGEGIQADSNAIVFVFARAASGPRMPLAVSRIKVADLPTTITLDDSMAMAPGLNLSSFEQVEIVAKISKNGIANPGSGDIEGSSGPLEVAKVSDVLSVVIDKVVP